MVTANNHNSEYTKKWAQLTFCNRFTCRHHVMANFNLKTKWVEKTTNCAQHIHKSRECKENVVRRDTDSILFQFDVFFSTLTLQEKSEIIINASENRLIFLTWLMLFASLELNPLHDTDLYLFIKDGINFCAENTRKKIRKNINSIYHS